MSSKRIVRVGTLGAIASLIGCNAGDERPAEGRPHDGGPSSVDAAVAQLKEDHPSAHVLVQNDRIRRVYGVTATGETSAAAAESFRQRSAAALGVAPDELTPTELGGPVTFRSSAATNANGVGLMVDPATGRPKFRLFTYGQQRDGVPVFRAGLRTLVRDDGSHPVVWANADLRPLGSFRAQAGAPMAAIDVDKSLQAVRTDHLAAPSAPTPTALAPLSAPTPTIFAGVGAKTVAPRMAMQYSARAVNGPGKWTFVADAATGDILYVESDLHFDIQGTVEAEVTAGQESMECGTLGIAPLPHAQVTSSAGNAFTEETGAFTIEESGSGVVTVTSSVTGEYFTVTNHAGNAHSLALEVAPPGPADFLHEDTATPPELVLAQLNAYKAANELRDMLLTYVPDYPIIAGQTNFEINVNRTDFTCETTGGAWYDEDNEPATINFCQRTQDRTNTAFGGIVHHEYGHHIIAAGGSGQNEYGEGMADAIAMLVAEDPRIAVGYRLNDCDEPLRRADNDCQFSPTECSSCGSGLYECGAVLTGVVWDIWQELNVTDPANADAIIRGLVFSSIPLHTGASIDESLAIDILTLDDDDTLVENGTPHYVEICAGFAAHGMSCPPIVDGLVVQGADLDAEGPSDGPFEPTSVTYTLHNLGPDEMTYAVTIPSEAVWLTVDSTGGTIPVGGEATVTISIDPMPAAALPDGDYSAMIEFVNQSSGTGTVSREARLRVGALVPIYTATFDEDLEGFTPDAEYGNIWHHSTACVDDLPGHTSPGSLYYGIDDRCNYTTSVPIRHTVTSPTIAIANPDTVELGFNYYLRTENDPNYDAASVLVSVDGGPFQLVASNNLGGEQLQDTNAWAAILFDISEHLPATGPTNLQVQLAFNAGDPDNNTRTGFVVDDITVHARPVASQECASDSECDDGLLCNGAELCLDDICTAGTPVACNDDNVCTTDTCDEATGCVYEANANPCDDDGDACTADICGDGVCTHPDNGSCSGGGPCAAYCSNPVTFSGSHYQSGNLGTQATCHETTAPLASGVCGNLAGARQLFVNGVPMNCNWNLWSLPPAQSGGYCIHTTGGDHPWASFSTWTW